VSAAITRRLSLNGDLTEIGHAFYKGGNQRVWVDIAPHFVASAALTSRVARMEQFSADELPSRWRRSVHNGIGHRCSVSGSPTDSSRRRVQPEPRQPHETPRHFCNLEHRPRRPLRSLDRTSEAGVLAGEVRRAAGMGDEDVVAKPAFRKLAPRAPYVLMWEACTWRGGPARRRPRPRF
jgi:hypothetical protein